jgi:hypothetical protein
VESESLNIQKTLLDESLCDLKMNIASPPLTELVIPLFLTYYVLLFSNVILDLKLAL